MGAITENPAIVAKATTMVGSSCEEYPIEINTLFPDDIFCNWKRYNQNGTVLISSLTTSENYLFRGNHCFRYYRVDQYISILFSP